MAPAPGHRLLRLNRLRVFERVGVTGAMSAAAGQLHLSQPAVTRSVRALERDLGVKLLERSQGGSFLTEEGRIFDRRTRRFFQQINTAVANVLGSNGEGDAVARLTRKISDVHVRSLIAISHAGSFRGAAKTLRIAEPTLHRAARGLERLMGVSLYQRTSDGIRLLSAGSELARRFAVATVEIKAGVEELALHRGAAATSMTIGVLVLAPKRLLSTVAETVLERHPKAQLTIREGAYDDLIDAMRSGAVDVVFGALRSPPSFDDLQEEPLFEDPYCVVGRRNHPLTRLRRPSRSALRGYDWIFPTAALPRRAVLDKFVAAWKLSSRVQIETNSLGAVTSALAVSDRLSLLPRGYVFGEDHSAQLKILDVPVPHPTRMVGLTTRRDWLPTGLHADFIALMRKVSRPRAARVRTHKLNEELG